MAIEAQRSSLVNPAQVPCAVAGGCGYLRALSTIEHLAGFERTARSYAAAAARCRDQGCWAAKAAGASGTQRTTGAAAVALKLVQPAPRRRSAVVGPSAIEPIPFSRSALIDIVSDGDGNYVERRALKLDSLPAHGDALGYLLRYWRQLRGASTCQFSNIDTVHLMRAGIIGKLHVVDVGSSDPSDFRYELLGYAVPVRYLEKPCTHPVAIYAESTMREYNTARLTAAPRLHRLRCRLSKTNHHYTRLILPFLNESGRVTRLAVAIREEPGNGIKIESSDNLVATHIGDE